MGSESNRARMEPTLVVLERVRQRAGLATPVVVFDIDSTLLDTSNRHLAILDDFLKHVETCGPLISARQQLARSGVGWSLVDDVRRAGIADPSLLQALHDFWRPRFFSPEYMRRDVPIPGAPHFVAACHALGAWCYYLTARVLEETEAVTRDTLCRFGFPLAARTTLQMKPSPRLDDHAFKRGALEAVARRGELVAAFDNDPENVNTFRSRFPAAVCVLVDTVRSPQAPPPAGSVLRIRDFTMESPLSASHSG